RSRGDGLRIFPGALKEGALFAAPWIPGPSIADADGGIAPEFLWAALDCAGAFAVGIPEGKLVLLGEICARVDGSVRAGEKCVVTAWARGSEGRTRCAGTAVFSEGGALIAVAGSTWIDVGESEITGGPK